MECPDEELRGKVRKLYPSLNVERFSTSCLMSLLPGLEPVYSHKLVAPLTEIISIRMKFNVNHDEQHKIYGTIQVTDGEGNTLLFYNREDDNPENIPNGGTLTLTFPNIIIPSNDVKVDVNLKDGDSNAEIVKGIFKWDCTTKAGYDERDVVGFKGKCGCVVLDYVTISHAVIARVDMMLRRRSDDVESTNVKMYGEITARYGDNMSYVLFDKKQVESVIQEYETHFELSRHVLAVPTVPPLEIFVKLFSGETRQQIVEGKIEFDVGSPFSKRLVNGQSVILRGLCETSYPYMQPPMGRSVQRANHFLKQPPSSTMIINRNPSSPYGEKLYEIYSVSVGGVNDKDIDLCGSIYVNYLGIPRFSLPLFNKDKDSSHRLLPYHTVPLTSYTECLAGLTLCVGTRLEDANGRVISSGYMSWSDKSFDEYWSLFNRQLCSIIEGNDGCYAAIHYSIFDAGVQAMIQIYLNKKEASGAKHVKIEGSICSQYSCYDYSSSYNKKYYRRQVFNRKSSEPWIHCPYSCVVLSECSVMVPMGSSLILDVNLEVMSKDVDMFDCVSQVRGSLKGQLEFKVDMSSLRNRATMAKKIEGSSHLILAHVEWRPYYVE